MTPTLHMGDVMRNTVSMSRGKRAIPDKRGVAKRPSSKTRPTKAIKKPVRKAVDGASRDRDVLRMLTLRVRCCSVAQVAKAAWDDTPTGLKNCKARLKALATKGLVGIATMLAHPEVKLEGPLAVWQPGLAVPDLASISHRGRKRWGGVPTRTEFVYATQQAVTLVGGAPGREPRPSEATHDLHLAAVYLRMREELATRSESWRSESLLAANTSIKRSKPGDKVPDAIVRDGRAVTAIEFVGEYSVDKLTAFHAYCKRAKLGYELW